MGFGDKDGSKGGKGVPGGARRNKNKAPCAKPGDKKGPGGGKGGGRGKGTGRKK